MSNNTGILKKEDKDLKLYNDFAKSISKLRLEEFKSNCQKYGNEIANQTYYYKKIQDKKLLKRLAKRLNITILF